MKANILTTTKAAFSNRSFMIAAIVLTFLTILFCLFVSLSIHVSDLQVVTHYTSFGSTNFYRDRWYYLIDFIVFGLMTLGFYIALACRLFSQKGRDLAVAFLLLGCAIILIAFTFTAQVMRLASFS